MEIPNKLYSFNDNENTVATNATNELIASEIADYIAKERKKERKRTIEELEEINYKSSYSFYLYCETTNKEWFEVKRSNYENCKNKMKELESKFGDTIQLEILYMVEASY